MIRDTTLVAIVVCSITFSVLLAAEQPANKLIEDTVQLSGTSELTESSGLAFSTRDPHCVWTHNDSGNAAKLFAFDTRTGNLTGECRLNGVDAADWESLTTAGKDFRELVVADSGDNDGRRDHISLYRFDEPDPKRLTELSPSDYQILHLRFPDGAVDCEAVWYDISESSLLFLGKGRLPFAGVYRVADSQWARKVTSALARNSSSNHPTASEILTAAKIATLALPMATGADRDPATGDIWIASYFQAFCFRRGKHTQLQSQLTDIPIATKMPPWRQIEAIAVDHKSQVWITSEGIPAKLGRLP